MKEESKKPFVIIFDKKVFEREARKQGIPLDNRPRIIEIKNETEKDEK